MSYDTNIQSEGECPDCLRFEKQIDKLHGDIDQLQKWKESEMALWHDLLQYFQFEDKAIKLGASISEEALRRSKAFPELLHALKLSHEEIKFILNDLKSASPGSYRADTTLRNNEEILTKYNAL